MLRELRWYQREVIEAVAESVLRRDGAIFSVIFGRQMGKNETSAMLECYLLNLFQKSGGSIIKAAPTFKPQTVISKTRLEASLDRSPLLNGRWRGRWGYNVLLGKARVAFFSGDKNASVVGETAELLLEVDEAQDFDAEKYNREFRPMLSTTNATTVLYGTAWSDDDLLQEQKRRNVALEKRTGRRLHFEFPWWHLAELSESYRRFVEAERDILGAEHPAFITQYELQTIPGVGRLLGSGAESQLQGGHAAETWPDEYETYVGGLDVGGEGAGDHDRSVLTIAKLGYRVVGDVALPVLQVVALYVWQGYDLTALGVEVLDLGRRVWGLAQLCVDGTGVGAGVASWLTSGWGETSVETVVFTQPVKSDLGFDFISAVASGRFTYYRPADEHSRMAIDEAVECRRELLPGNRIAWAAPEEVGKHDDFPVSGSLCVRAGLSGAPAIGGMVEAGDVLDEDWG